MNIKTLSLTTLAVGAGLVCSIPFFTDLNRNAQAADHAEAPALAHDAGADIADMFMFLDPRNTNNVVLIMTLHGFVAPAENVNLGYFDPEVRYRFELERTGDAKVDDEIDVQFEPRTGTSIGQTAKIKLPNGHTFTALATAPSLADTGRAPVLTTNADGVVFFAGLTDDPFFFDIPAFNRFVGGVLSTNADAGTNFSRGRDSFAGYNIPAIALSVPAELVRPIVRGTNVNHTLGMAGRTQRRTESTTAKGEIKSVGAYRNVDRMGIPAVNTALIPFAKKNLYNASTTADDAKGKFATEILATLTALGTDDTYKGILASVAVLNGDFLRLDLNVPNSGVGTGLPVLGAPDSFPNGRRLQDDVIDIILTLIANGTSLGDNVNANYVPFASEFPFLGASQQPRASGVLDDNTRN